MAHSSQAKSKEFTVHSILALIGGWLALFCTLGFQNAFGVFQEYYRRIELKRQSDFDIAWIGSLALFMVAALSAPFGLLVDRMGPSLLLTIGPFGTCFSFLMISLCDRYYQFILAQGVLLGSSNALLICPSMMTISRLFNRHRGAATGIMLSGTSAGGIMWPIVLDRLLNHDGISDPWTFRIVGFTVLPPCMYIAWAVRLPQKTSTEQPRQPEEQGHEIHQPVENDTDPSQKSFTNNTTFTMLCVGFALTTFGLFTPMYFASRYAVDRDISTSLSFYLASMVNGASMVGRLGSGFLADWYGNFNMFFLSITSSGIIALCWTKATSVAATVLFALAYGLTSGAIFSLQNPCAVQLSMSKSQGMAIGLVFAASAIPELIGTPISGYLVKHGYLSLAMYSGATLIAGGFLVLYARLRQNRELLARI